MTTLLVSKRKPQNNDVHKSYYNANNIVAATVALEQWEFLAVENGGPSNVTPIAQIDGSACQINNVLRFLQRRRDIHPYAVGDE